MVACMKNCYFLTFMLDSKLNFDVILVEDIVRRMYFSVMSEIFCSPTYTRFYDSVLEIK